MGEIKKKEINLDDYRSPNVRVFTGRVRGEKVRVAAKVPLFDEMENVQVTVIVPDDVTTIASSFFLGMFGDSIRRLEKDGFLKKYKFEGPNIDLIVSDGVEQALKYFSPLV